jgi:hypothetical protein
MVPAREAIAVLSGPGPDDKRMVDVQWGDKKRVMFYEDIQTRSEGPKENQPRPIYKEERPGVTWPDETDSRRTI